MNVIGLDIGTTTLCAAVFRAEDGAVLDTVSEPSVPFSENDAPGERTQDADGILCRAEAIISHLTEKYAPVGAIGITGQMHGIVYLDRTCRPQSPLYTWQDRRAAMGAVGASTLDRIFEKTGYRVNAGYGLGTHLYMAEKGLVSPYASSLSTIHAALAARLCGHGRAKLHASDAASLGLFDLAAADFDPDAAAALGIDRSFLPDVTAGTECIGTYRGIPVAVAIGDNQASFLGTVSGMDGAVLCNVGTGAQISVMTKELSSPPVGELRPLTEGTYLFCGCSLCGGKALSLLERFFRECVRLCGGEDVPRYDMICRLEEEAAALPAPLRFDTLFCGSRKDPDATASVSGLTEDNFTPAHFVRGVLDGIARELCDEYRAFAGTAVPQRLYGSGNGIRKNKALQAAFERELQTGMLVPRHCEEAAAGAAFFAADAAGILPLAASQQRILYR